MAILLSFLLALGQPGCGEPEVVSTNTSPRRSADASSAIEHPEGSPAIATIDPVESSERIEVTADEFRQEAKANIKAARERYDGKPISLTGVAHSFVIGNDGTGSAAYLNVGASVDSSSLVGCRIEKPWEKVSIGDAVTVHGKGNFIYGAQRLIDASIVSDKGNPTPRLTAKELVTAAINDPDKAREVHDDKVYVVTGTVVETTVGNEDGRQFILLDGGDGKTLEVGVFNSRNAQSQFGSVKVGDTLAVLGEFYIFNGPDPDFGIHSAYSYNIGALEPKD